MIVYHGSFAEVKHPDTIHSRDNVRIKTTAENEA